MLHEKHITLSELLADVRRTLAERFPLGVWICAEVGEIKENRYSGHCYMELIEKGDNDGTPKAKASAAVWRSRWGMLSAHFQAATGEPLSAGMKVLLKVSVTFHESYGLSLVVNDIDPAYTIGEQEQRRRQTIEQLTAEGVIDLNKTLDFPTVIQRIAVISSATAAGYQDFMNHLAASPYRIEATLFEAIVQGAAAEQSIIDALGRVADREEEFDAVAILRGGGSQSDLGCFNAYPLSAHIAQFPLPVLTGIGHDKDTSVADLVAHTALKTPTAVADFLVERITGYHSEIEYAYERILTASSALLESHRTRLERNNALVCTLAEGLLRRMEVKLERASVELHHSVARLIEAHKARLERAEVKVEASSPQRILAMGFSVVRQGGRALTSADNIEVGNIVEIVFADGKATATITDKTK